MSKRNRDFSNSFPFFEALKDFYLENKGKIRRNYKDVTRKYLDYNDKSINPDAFLRKPQFEALEMYVFLKEFMDNKHVHEIFSLWKERQDMFSERSYYAPSSTKMGQLSFYDEESEQYDEVFNFMKKYAEDYPNYIYALTMGVGKTILMATCIFYDFLLASKYPKDSRFIHNALVFAPDRTVRQSLREIETFDRSRVIPKEYANVLNSNIKFHFLDDDASTLNTIDGSSFNLIISNTQKIILKTKRTETSAKDKFMNMASYIKEEFADIDDFYGDLDELIDEKEVITNQRFEKLKRLKQLGIYVDEAHHMFGTELKKSQQKDSSKTSLRNTINELANVLEAKGSKVVACYNYTGTPYVNNTILPDVVSYYGLKEAIDSSYLKTVDIQGYENVKEEDFLKDTITKFFNKHGDKTYEGLLPKLAIFGSTVDELINDVKPAVEKILFEMGISTDKILVNVGDEKYTKDNDINNFNNLDVVGTEGSKKQIILLVGKGKEGWNCRSLFGVALYRKPKSTIFVLQATMRCLRQITEEQQEGNVYMSKENLDILTNELNKNFKLSLKDVTSSGSDKVVVNVKVVHPIKYIPLSEIKHHYELIEQNNNKPIDFRLRELDLSKYESKIYKTSDLSGTQTIKEEIIDIEENKYSLMEIVFEISRYLNMNPLEIEELLDASVDGVDDIVEYVNKFNLILWDVIIYKVFSYFYRVDYHTESINVDVPLIRGVSEESQKTFSFSVKEELLLNMNNKYILKWKDKSFHVDNYCFDSKPELELFYQYLKSDKVKEVYFTGMFTSSNNGLEIQYIDPTSNIVRNYYPDFIVEMVDGTFEIIEVKGDDKIDDELVQAKAYAALELAETSNMKYNMFKSSDIMKKNMI